jgi:aspartate/methionine/tyrosine aminotransferase
MIDSVETANAVLREGAPALFAALSPLGRRAFFPQDIPFQAAEARGKRFNGTIGQITDGRGGAVPLPSLAAGLAALPAEARNRALLYSPVEGLPELRRRWREWQRRDLPGDGEGTAGAAAALSTLPVVTAGLTHALSLAADLFGGEGRVLAVPGPYWGNYRQAFALRTGVRVVSEPAFDGGRYDPEALSRSLAGAGLGAGEPALALVNAPSNPGGYSPNSEERRALAASLARAATERPLVVLCDDAYAGLVFEGGVPARSLFWDLQSRHPNLVPVKIDGVTKELAFFGGRVGFLTFALAPGSPAEAALESKVKCLLRAGIGSPVATSQVLALQALESGRAAEEVEAVRRLLAGRYRILREALGACDGDLLRPLPFNSGCFALVALGPRARAAGLTAHRVRRHLLEAEDTGLVAVGDEHLRIAHCSVAEEDLPELVERLIRGVATLVSG